MSDVREHHRGRSLIAAWRRLLVRLLGVGVSNFENPEQVQGLLFDDPAHERQSRLDAAADKLKERFGGDALRRGSVLLHEAQHRPPPRPFIKWVPLTNSWVVFAPMGGVTFAFSKAWPGK